MKKEATKVRFLMKQSSQEVEQPPPSAAAKLLPGFELRQQKIRRRSPARNYEPNDTKIGSIRAQMSPNQGLKALLEGSNRNSDYQTVSKFDNLIVESSGSTRRVQRAQEHRNPTSLSQKIVHQTIHDQGIQYRPSIPNHSLFPRIYGPCHSKKSINRAPSLLEKEPGEPEPKEIKGEIEDRSCPLAPPRPPPELRRTTAIRPYTSPDHHLKALHSAGPPPEGPKFNPRP
ncbi:hypothetical protein M5K25_004940 [Dendrobium thyrsiflorum]|uniref:Uncharacterized protein n=1 Tax=Dendrobium thyrsiflorum TaxID=117978 RepID=A0ABD0VNJ4_DENTH